MARTRLAPNDRLHTSGEPRLCIGVRLRSVGDEVVEPPLGRSLLVAPRHTFAELALAIDEAFCRWDIGRRRLFVLEDGTRVGDFVASGGESRLDYRRTRLQRLYGGERFGYVVVSPVPCIHECTLLGPVDPAELGADQPGHPVVYQSSS